MNTKPDRYAEVKILLVEDDDIDAKSIERALARVKVANPMIRVKNGLEALELLRGEDALERPYIILLDLNMPVMGGLEFLREIRQDDDLRDSVVFVLTTSEADEDKVAAYKENVAGYIMKFDSEGGMIDIVNMLNQYWKVVVLPP